MTTNDEQYVPSEALLRTAWSDYCQSMDACNAWVRPDGIDTRAEFDRFLARVRRDAARQAEAERDEWRQTALDERAAALDALEQVKVREAERDAARGYISELETAVRSRNDVIQHRDARIKAVRELHVKEPGVGTAYCIDCEQPLPCDTVRALDGDA